MKDIIIEKMPSNMDEFIALRNEIADTPYGGAAIFVVALKMYAENPQIGLQSLVVAIDRSELTPGSAYKGFDVNRFVMARLKEQVSRFPYIGNSYFEGAVADNGYTPQFPSKMDISINSYSGDINSGYYKVFIRSNGADSPRPIILIRNDKGLWKAKGWGSIIMGIREPKQEISDDL